MTGATLVELPVAFDVQPTQGGDRERSVITTGRSRVGQGVLWVVMVTFGRTAIMVRRHLHAGEGDLHGARLWPRTLITWTRALSRRFHDSPVGRDLLLSILAGTVMAVASLLVFMMHERSPDDTALLPTLHSLRSSRLFVSRVLFLVLDSMQLTLGSLFMLVLLRVVLRRTWLAVLCLLLLNLPLTEWNWTPTAVVYGLATAGLFCVVVLRLGLLASVVILATERLLTSLPITLDLRAWYIGQSGLVLLLILGLPLVASRLTLLRAGLAVSIAVANHGRQT